MPRRRDILSAVSAVAARVGAVAPTPPTTAMVAAPLAATAKPAPLPLGDASVVGTRYHAAPRVAARLRAVHQTAGFLQENSLKRCALPHAVGDEMMKLVIAKLTITGCHRLDTLAVTRANQARNVRWAQSHPGLVQQRRQKWRQPNLQIATPVVRHRHHPVKLAHYESGKPLLGNLEIRFMPK